MKYFNDNDWTADTTLDKKIRYIETLETDDLLEEVFDIVFILKHFIKEIRLLAKKYGVLYDKK